MRKGFTKSGFTPLENTSFSPVTTKKSVPFARVRNLKSRRNSLTGFTLIELLVIMAIIGILSSIIISDSRESRARALDVKRVNDIRQIRNALELYYLDNSEYPPTPLDGNGPDHNIVANCFEWSPDGINVPQGSFDEALKGLLIANGGSLKEIPKPPGYPGSAVFPICYFYVSPYFGNEGPCGGKEFALGFGLESLKLTNFIKPFISNDNVYCLTP